MQRLLSKWLVVIGLFCVAFISVTGVLDRGLRACGLKYITQANEDYLEKAFEKSLSGFLLLSSIKSGLAVVEGSEVGVGFSLELGDVVQPVYDYVDIAWRAALAGGSIIVGMQLALKGIDFVDHLVLTGAWLTLCIQLLLAWFGPSWPWLQGFLKEMVRFGFALAVAFYLLLPLSVTAAAVLSKHITGPLVESSHDQLRQIDKEIKPENLNQNVLADMAGAGLSAPSLKTRLTDTVVGIQMLVTFLKNQTEKVAAMAFKLIAAYLFDCILFPLFFGLIFMTMLRSGVRYFFEIRPHPVSEE